MVLLCRRRQVGGTLCPGEDVFLEMESPPESELMGSLQHGFHGDLPLTTHLVTALQFSSNPLTSFQLPFTQWSVLPGCNDALQ